MEQQSKFVWPDSQGSAEHFSRLVRLFKLEILHAQFIHSNRKLGVIADRRL